MMGAGDRAGRSPHSMRATPDRIESSPTWRAWLVAGYRELLEGCARPSVAALLALLVAAPTLWVGWLGDDFWQRLVLDPAAPAARLRSALRESGAATDPGLFTFARGSPACNGHAASLGIVPWWIEDDTRISFWRPLAELSHRLDYRLWPEAVSAMHLHSILWYVLLAAMVAVLFGELIALRWVAGLATLLFVVCASHVSVVVWLANRNALLAASGISVALLGHMRWRSTGDVRWALGASLGFVAGLLSAEAGAAGLGFLLAHVLFLDEAPWRSRAASLAPYVLVLLAWRGAHQRMGSGAHGSGIYVDPTGEPVEFVFAVVERLPLLLGSLCTSVPAHLVESLSLRGQVWTSRLAWLAVVVFAGLARRSLTCNRLRLFLATGTVLATIPFCANAPHSRNLLIPGMGGLALVALVIGDWISLARHGAGRPIRALAVLAAATGLAIHLVFAVAMSLCIPGAVRDDHSPAAEAAGATIPEPVTDTDTLVLVTAPSSFLAYYFFPMRLYGGRPCPGWVRILAPATDRVTVSRPDANTLVVRPASGYLVAPGESIDQRGDPVFRLSPRHWHQHFEWFFSSPRRAWRAGWTRAMAGVDVEVMSLASDGRPADVRFRFEKKLDDLSLRWFFWDRQRGTYAPFRPPPIGTAASL